MKKTPSYGFWFSCTMWIKGWLPSPQRGRGAGGEGDRHAVIGCLALRIQQACSACMLCLLLLLVLPSQARSGISGFVEDACRKLAELFRRSHRPSP